MLRSISEFKFFQSLRIPVEDADEVRFLVEVEQDGETSYLKDARLVDISVHGLGLTTGKRLSVGQDLRVSLHFKKINLDLEATVIRAFTGGMNGQTILYGVEFVEEEVDDVKKFLEIYINSFSSERLRDCLVEMSLVDRYSTATEGLEMFSLLISLFNDMTNFAEKEDFIDTILEEINRILNAQRAALFLVNPDTNELEAVTALGIDKKLLRFDYRKGIPGTVFTTGVSLNIDTTNDSKRFAQEIDSLTGQKTRSVICNPIHNREDKIIGVIEVANKIGEERFTMDDEKIMKVVSLIFSSIFHNYNPLAKQSTIRRFSAPSDRELILIGRSKIAMAIRNSIIRLKDLDTPVYLHGEVGTGKALLARIIHTEGRRGLKPIEEIICNLKDNELLEQDLFGTEEIPSKWDKCAQGGAVVLREVHELTLKQQKRLVEMLVQRMGQKDQNAEAFDVRIFVTSCKNLEKLVQEGSFDEKLYELVADAYVELAPLRKRAEDIKDLINYFMRVECRRQGFLLKTLAPSVMTSFLEYEWPGNIRELQTTIARLVVYNPKNHVIGHLGNTAIPLLREQANTPKIFEDIPYASDANIVLKDRLAVIERQLILNEIKRHNGNKSKAAREMGISREALRKKLMLSQEILDALDGNVKKSPKQESEAA